MFVTSQHSSRKLPQANFSVLSRVQSMALTLIAALMLLAGGIPGTQIQASPPTRSALA